MKKLPLWLKYLIALPITLVAILLGVFVFMPNALAEDAPTIDAPSQVRLPLAGSNLALLTLQAKNIQVRAEWDVEGNDSADFSVEGGTLVLVAQVTSATTKSAVVVVRDKFSYLNSSYTDLEAKATINFEFISRKIFILGGLASDSTTNQSGYRNDVWSSVDGATWEPLNNAGWGARTDFGAVSHNGSIFVMGGRDANSPYNDVWSSPDGSSGSWTKQEGTKRWSARYGLRAVSHGGLIYVSGGDSIIGSGGVEDDVWSSEDGKNWTQRATTKFTARAAHEMVSLGGAMFVMGGSGSGYLRDIWESGDGVTWNYRGTDWGGNNGRRSNFYAITYDGQMYIMGGNRNANNVFAEVWSSSNGLTWSKKTGNAGWGRRRGLGAASFGSQMYVIGGREYVLQSGTYTNRSDAWRSGNGKDWTKITPDAGAGWAARYGHRIVVHTLP